LKRENVFDFFGAAGRDWEEVKSSVEEALVNGKRECDNRGLTCAFSDGA